MLERFQQKWLPLFRFECAQDIVQKAASELIGSGEMAREGDESVVFLLFLLPLREKVPEGRMRGILRRAQLTPLRRIEYPSP